MPIEMIRNGRADGLSVRYTAEPDRWLHVTRDSSGRVAVTRHNRFRGEPVSEPTEYLDAATAIDLARALLDVATTETAAVLPVPLTPDESAALSRAVATAWATIADRVQQGEPEPHDIADAGDLPTAWRKLAPVRIAARRALRHA